MVFTRTFNTKIKQTSISKRSRPLHGFVFVENWKVDHKKGGKL